MTRSPIVLCIEFDTYVCALAAVQTLAERPAHKATATRLLDAAGDLQRAHAMYALHDSAVLTPALLKRQAE